ncbi:hypothetical protein TM49_17205 [Martelella endophytica]|uniref:Uncharacterized protein n=1 Tax=Martelella endophytica TaxID=1486262 RepID=A0A0D5LUJ2_MAREN|nr:hypothetical protein TM49_17205 [Martelella endophytica]
MRFGSNEAFVGMVLPPPDDWFGGAHLVFELVQVKIFIPVWCSETSSMTWPSLLERCSLEASMSARRMFVAMKWRSV